MTDKELNEIYRQWQTYFITRLSTYPADKELYVKEILRDIIIPLIKKAVEAEKLDRPELWGKVESILLNYRSNCERIQKEWRGTSTSEIATRFHKLEANREEAIKQILALFPSEEAIRKYAMGQIAYKRGAKAERERIIEILEDNTEIAFGIPYINQKVLQSLKD